MKRLLVVLALLIVFIPAFLLPGAAEAIDPPPVCPVTWAFSTLPATDVHDTTATLHGKLCMIGIDTGKNSAGGYSPFVFRYGIRPGFYTHTVDAEVKSAEVYIDRVCLDVVAPVTGLTSCDQYYVRFQLAPDFIPYVTCPIIMTGPETKFSTTGCRIGPYGQGGSTSNSGTSSSLSSLPASAPVQMANVLVQSAAIATTKVSPGQDVDIAASVTNKGTANGDAKLTLYVNGEAVESKGVTVASGQTAPVHFYVSRNEPGTYSVLVNGVPAGSFTVDIFTNNDGFIYGIMALLLLGITGIVYLMVRKKTA